MRTLLALPAALLLAACSSSSNKGPVIASSSGQSSYAVRYADELSSATKRFNDDDAATKQLLGAFGGDADALKKADWNDVAKVVDDSDAAGKSADFVEARGELEAVRTFWAEEKDPITQKVGGNAQYAAQKAGCSGGDVAGAVAYSLNDAFDKELRDRLRAHNEANVVVTRDKEAIGKDDTDALQKLADDVAEASYLVHVDVVVQRERIKKLLADKDGVKSTLDRFVQEEATYQAQAGRSDADKKASADRVAAANKAKADIDGAVAQADALLKEVDQRIEALNKDYDDNLGALKATITQRAKSSPAKS